jgi:hypothetical protein
MRPRHALIGLSVATAALLGGGTAFAAQLTPGVPGTAECRGQTEAYVTQGNPIPGVSGTGIGNVARANNLSVTQLNDAIGAFCGI